MNVLPRVGDDQHGLEPAQRAIGAPLLGELDRGAPQRAALLAQLLVEPLEQRDAVGRRAGEPADRAAVAEPAHLAAPPLTTVLPSVTWPSPATTTEPPRRTERIVVECVLHALVRSTGSSRRGRLHDRARADSVRSSSRAGVGVVVDLHQVVERHLRVDLRRRQAGVAEQLLDRAEVDALVEQVGRERVAQAVRRGPAWTPPAIVQRWTMRCTERGVSRTPCGVDEQRGIARAERLARRQVRGERASALPPTGTSRDLPPLPRRTSTSGVL